MKKQSLMLSILFFLLFVNVVSSLEPVVIELLYFEPCPTCPNAEIYHEVYLHSKEVISNVQSFYGSNVTIHEIMCLSTEGRRKLDQYNLTIGDWNSIIVNYETTFVGGHYMINETYLREVIDSYLTGNPLPNSQDQSSSLMTTFVLAFSFGFFETFSPCLIILLSFVLSHNLTPDLKENFLRVMSFGTGFVLASLLLGITFGYVFYLLPNLQILLTFIVCIFAMIFGLNLVGLLKSPFQAKPLIKKLTKKHSITYFGLSALGFIFYFLDPCIAPIFVSMIPMMYSSSTMLPFILLMFSIGVILPFVLIGFLVGSMSKLVRTVYKGRFKIRVISGLILIVSVLYVIAFYLFPKLSC